MKEHSNTNENVLSKLSAYVEDVIPETITDFKRQIDFNKEQFKKLAREFDTMQFNA